MGRIRLRGRLYRHRRRPAPLYGHPRRKPEGRLLRQRVPDPLQPDEGLPPRQPHPHLRGQKGGRGGRRQRGHGRRPQRALRLGAETVYIVYRRGNGGAARPQGGKWSTPREEGIVLQDPHQPRGHPCPTTRALSGPSAASRWSWASPTPPAAAAPSRVPGSEFENGGQQRHHEPWAPAPTP